MTERMFHILLGAVLIVLLVVGRPEWIAAYILFGFRGFCRVPGTLQSGVKKPIRLQLRYRLFFLYLHLSTPLSRYDFPAE